MSILKFLDHNKEDEKENAIKILHELEECFVEVEDEFGIYAYYEFHQSYSDVRRMFKVIFPDDSSGGVGVAGSLHHGGHEFGLDDTRRSKHSAIQKTIGRSYFRIFFSYGDMDGGGELLQRIQSICKILDQKINMEVEYFINSTTRGTIGFTGSDIIYLQRKDFEKKGIQVILFIN
jgi:hypothetical protein